MFGLLAATGARADTFDGVLRTAHANPRLLVARARYLASTARTAIAAASGRPQLSFNADITRNFDTDVYGPRLRDEATAQLSVPIYQGGRLHADLMAARADQRSQRAAVDVEAGRLAVDVADVYAELREGRALRGIAADEVERFSGYARRIEAERQAGIATLTEAAECRSRLATARRDAVEAERREANAAARFEQLVGRLPADELMPIAIAPLDVADLAAAVHDGNPELRSLREDVDAARYRIGSQRALGRPTLSLIASGSYGNSGMGLDDTANLLPSGTLQQVGSPRRFAHRLAARGLLVFSMPISRGGEVSARVAQAEATRDAAQARVQAREAALLAEARQALGRARSALRQQDLVSDAIGAGREALKGVDIARSVGEQSEHDVLVAASELGASGRQRARLEHDASVQAVKILAATGRLSMPGSMVGHFARSLPPAPAVSPAPQLAGLHFDLADVAGSKVASPSRAPGRRPLAYDLSGIG